MSLLDLFLDDLRGDERRGAAAGPARVAPTAPDAPTAAPTPTPNPKDDWKFPASYLRIGRLDASVTASLAADVARFDDALWREEHLTTYLSEHLNTVILLHHERRHRLWEELDLERRLAPLFALLRDFYGGGEPVLVCVDRLCARTTIPSHRDGPQLRPPYPATLPSFYRRTHVPLITSKDVEFVIRDERRHLAPGEVWEINNWRVHRVENRGEIDRVHLLVDWNAPVTSRRDAR